MHHPVEGSEFSRWLGMRVSQLLHIIISANERAESFNSIALIMFGVVAPFYGKYIAQLR